MGIHGVANSSEFPSYNSVNGEKKVKKLGYLHLFSFN